MAVSIPIERISLIPDIIKYKEWPISTPFDCKRDAYKARERNQLKLVFLLFFSPLL
jgi:hypothetical protein